MEQKDELDECIVNIIQEKFETEYILRIRNVRYEQT